MQAYNVTEDSRAANVYYFWVRPTSQWNCTYEEFKRTFDALDDAAVKYEINAYEEPLRRFFLPFCFLFTFAYYGVWLGNLINFKCKRGENSNRCYVAFTLPVVIAQLVCLILFIVGSINAINQAAQHEKNVELVIQNFDGRCTDENVKYDFAFDVNLSAY